MDHKDISILVAAKMKKLVDTLEEDRFWHVSSIVRELAHISDYAENCRRMIEEDGERREAQRKLRLTGECTVTSSGGDANPDWMTQ